MLCEQDLKKPTVIAIYCFISKDLFLLREHCPLHTMSNEEVVIISEENLDEPQYQRTIPQFFDEGGKSESNKRKNSDTEESSQTPAKSQRKSKIFTGDREAVKLLHQILSVVNNLELRVSSIENVTKSLKEEILLINTPINTETKIDSLIGEMQIVKNTILELPKGDVISTQAALMETAQMEVEVAPEVNPTDYIGDWDDYIDKRKKGFNKHLNNHGRREIHIDWKIKDPPFIPALYLPKKLRFGESDREYELRKQQKLNEFDTYLDLLAVRMEEGFAVCEAVDSHMEESISDLAVDEGVRDALRTQYKKKIEADEESCRKNWESTAKGLQGKPQRESESKIVVENNRVYAISKSLKKPKEAKVPITPKTDKKKPDKSAKSASVNVRNDDKNWSNPKKKTNPNKWYNARPYQPWNTWNSSAQNYRQMSNPQPSCSHQYPVVNIGQVDVAQPPPPLINKASSFQLANQQNMWAHLPSNVAL